MNNLIFNSIEDINCSYGVSLTLPNDLPEGSNVLCYAVEDFSFVKMVAPYKEDSSGLYCLSEDCEVWERYNDSLKLEAFGNFIYFGAKYIYLRLTQQVDDKPKFVPERLLGVQTDRGHIISTEQAIVVCEGSGGWYAETLKYYISDDSDETVSFEEYIKLFYNTEDTL